MGVLEALENYTDRCHSVVCNILDITGRLYYKGFDIVFCWLPSHVGIIGNEQADSAARSGTTYQPLAVPLSDMKHVILHHILTTWQESWSQQLDNKLHSVKPVIRAWPVIPMRRTDVKFTRLRIDHTRFTHRHLLFGENAPECPSCKVETLETSSSSFSGKKTEGRHFAGTLHKKENTGIPGNLSGGHASLTHGHEQGTPVTSCCM
ncbi:RNase H domain-containing protein [Trichonephila clavipes]|nr:RNase H domain-containing protein [Trichonephila clavipes]